MTMEPDKKRTISTLATLTMIVAAMNGHAAVAAGGVIPSEFVFVPIVDGKWPRDLR